MKPLYSITLPEGVELPEGPLKIVIHDLVFGGCPHTQAATLTPEPATGGEARAEFEAFWPGDLTRWDDDFPGHKDDYWNLETRAGWLGFQAGRRKETQPPAPQDEREQRARFEEWWMKQGSLFGGPKEKALALYAWQAARKPNQ